MIAHLTVKPGVRFDRILPAGFRILGALDAAAQSSGLTLTITCGTEGHGPDDPHSLGEAYDVSVAGLDPIKVIGIYRFLLQFLGEGFTVLYEVPEPPALATLASIAYVNTVATAPHFHIQRKRGTRWPPLEAKA